MADNFDAPLPESELEQWEVAGKLRKTLLDTHALIWLASSPDKINDEAVEQFSDPATRVWVSTA
ncbi:hypothetical protein MANY_13050 [Mycolicibacterium anyangense]|uniref:PIN domain-containing protein n=1 Tax=Mycolicibacterium anyangense TaxID=1431246 RepID=A0A6N4W617_9MYCO|nr:hypothetical protein [Mycolicibacterium anyangense]BBZ75968.1 hypothetical protein MANY_13050 [Mycolicibacterium anyangense]